MASPISIATQGITTSQFDLNAISFLSAAGITDATQKYAINNLVVGLKQYSLWSKMQAIYPFVGGTSTTHKWNLKSPIDADSDWRIVFNGGFTHNANGITPNGTNAYANTFYDVSVSGSLNDQHVAIYSRTNSLRDCKDLGVLTTGSDQLTIDTRSSANEFTSGVNSSDDVSSGLFGTSLGFFLSSRVASNQFKIYRNGTLAKTPAVASSARAGKNVYLCALNNNGTAQQFSDRNLAFATVGLGLSDTDVANLYTVVQAYQTTLGRQV